MAYTVANPSTGNVYFDTSASALTDATQPKPDGGACTNLGANQTLLDELALGSTQKAEKCHESRTDSDGVSSTLPKSGRTFNSMAAEQWIMMRAGVQAEYIAGTADTALRCTSSYPGLRRSPKYRETIRGPLTATAIRYGRWHIVSGTWVPTSGADTTVADSTDGIGDVAGLLTGGSDHAATISASRPGELVFFRGSGITPDREDYAARTTW